MIPKQLDSFVNRVFSETENGSISWSEGSENDYFSEGKGITLHVGHGYYEIHDSTIVNFYSFRVVSSGTGDVAHFSVTEAESQAEYMFMKKLYESVSVSASNIVDHLGDFFS